MIRSPLRATTLLVERHTGGRRGHSERGRAYRDRRTPAAVGGKRPDPAHADLRRAACPGPLVLVGVVQVQQRRQVRVGLGERAVGEQSVLVELAHAAALEQRRGPQEVVGDQGFHDPQQRGAVGGRERVPISVSHGESHVHIIARGGGDHGVHEGGMEQRHVGRRDIGPVGAVADGRQPGREALERAAALARVVDQLHAVGQRRQLLSGGAHHDHRTVDRPRHDAGDAVQQRRAVPFERGLRPAHARRPAPGQHDARGRRLGARTALLGF